MPFRGYRDWSHLSVDNSTRALNVIACEHHEVHAGSHYFVTGYQDLAINEVLDFTFQTPNTTKWIHLLWNVQTQSETNWFEYEGAVVTNALANAVTPLNSNRNSESTSGVTLKYEKQGSIVIANADTDVSTATTLASGISGAGKDFGFSERQNEVVLKQNTIYCFRAIATAAGYLNFDMHWYEHTNKDEFTP